MQLQNRDGEMKDKQLKSIHEELEVLKDLSQYECPFIISIKCAFNDKESLFLVTDLATGSDLAYNLRLQKSKGLFSEIQVKFFMAQLIIALRFIHKKGYCHGNLSIDNILIDSNGYLKVADFG